MRGRKEIKEKDRENKIKAVSRDAA